jgi:putative ABC transport system substrate-binding protein
VYRVGYLGTTPATAPEAWSAFREALGERGWVEGQNLAIEQRYSDGFFDRFPHLAAELVRLKVDVITTRRGGPPSARRSRRRPRRRS